MRIVVPCTLCFGDPDFLHSNPDLLEEPCPECGDDGVVTVDEELLGHYRHNLYVEDTLDF